MPVDNLKYPNPTSRKPRALPSQGSSIPENLKMKAGGFSHRRPLVLGIAVATTLVTGTLIGASMKTTSDKKQLAKEFKEAPVDQIIGVLETQRQALVVKRNLLETKIKEVRARIDAEAKNEVEATKDTEG